MGNRVTYISQGLYAGPAPSSGYYFIDVWSGDLSNDDTGPFQDNLLFDIHRVQSVTYDFEVERQESLQIGKKGTTDRPIIEHPDITLSFNYLQNGLKNEARIGFVVNYGQFENIKSGEAKFKDNFSVDLLSGLTERGHLEQPSQQPFWPLNYRDARNFHLAVLDDDCDLFDDPKRFDYETESNNLTTHPKAKDFHVISFGNCYLTSWATRAAVNSLPESDVGFVCENIKFDLEGSGIESPAISSNDRSAIKPKKTFNIPQTHNHEGAAVLHPGDITIDINSNKNNKIDDFGLNFNDILINGYEISLDLPREKLQKLGHKLPVDRQINYPVFVNFSFDITVNNENQTGSLAHLLSEDETYDVTIKLRNPNCKNQDLSDVPPGQTQIPRDVAIRYDFLNAKFQSLGYSTNVGDNKTAQINFTTELDPENLGNEGFYISGLLNIDKVQDYLVDSSGFYLVDGDGNHVATNPKALF